VEEPLYLFIFLFELKGYQKDEEAEGRDRKGYAFIDESTANCLNTHGNTLHQSCCTTIFRFSIFIKAGINEFEH
jgi:hypothetical protein